MNAHDPHSPAAFHRPLKTVVIGTALDPGSDAVVRTGLAVARAAGARVYLVHAAEVEPPLALASGSAADLVAAETVRCEKELEAEVARLGIAPAELAGTRVEAGRAYRVVVEAARATGAGLVVLGATAAGPLAAELLGSTADRVLRQATCPVLVVRGAPRIPPARVLAAVDLSELSGDAFRCGLDLLAQLAPGRKTEVRAAYAQGILDAAGRRRAVPGLAAGEEDQLAAGELARSVGENRPAGPFAIEPALLPGEARYEILRELAVHPADLVMLGTHGRGGLDRLILGSVAATVARRATVSVLMVPPEAALGEGIAESILARTTPAWHPEPHAEPAQAAS